VEEKYKLCDESLSKLLQWISEVEDKLANQDTVKEDVEELRKQIITMKVSTIHNNRASLESRSFRYISIWNVILFAGY